MLYVTAVHVTTDGTSTDQIAFLEYEPCLKMLWNNFFGDCIHPNSTFSKFNNF